MKELFFFFYFLNMCISVTTVQLENFNHALKTFRSSELYLRNYIKDIVFIL